MFEEEKKNLSQILYILTKDDYHKYTFLVFAVKLLSVNVIFFWNELCTTCKL
jgi:hypothetical protein